MSFPAKDFNMRMLSLEPPALNEGGKSLLINGLRKG